MFHGHEAWFIQDEKLTLRIMDKTNQSNLATVLGVKDIFMLS